MNSRVIVSAVIIKDGKYLLGQKKKDVGPYPNTWHLIGGGVDLENETLEEGTRREIREEAGIEVSDLENLSFDEDNEPNKHGKMTHYLFLRYQTEFKSGELKADDDIDQLRLFIKEELKSIPLPGPLTKLFKEMGLI